MPKQNATKVFFATLPKNIFSGFVVSLIALPLGLGLAIASEAPPIAGIIAAIAGGVIVSLFGGSHLTIAGPGNGLVIVLFGAITTLGGGDYYQGYLFTLAAIIISGVLLFLFGVLRLGGLSEFFPASALQGMLAAIGLGILAKQFHVMLGFVDIKGSTLMQLLAFPSSVLRLFSSVPDGTLWACAVGVLSLVFLFLYARIRNPLFHLIPAPMWVVIGAISLSYYFEYVANAPYPIANELLIQLPDSLVTNLPRPDFGLLLTKEFIAVVLSITLIASIESLLSIKAVDKLDAEKRRSNVNKDLRALGLATVVSGFLGGLNVVTVIARSSVNANNGGTNRSANFFHAFFLVLFVVLFAPQIQRIPLPALAAILVYTGYRLAAPENLLRISKIGFEQALIFMVTLVVTLISSLISGIAMGLLTTFLVHLVLNKSIVLFSRNWLKPNVLMFQEPETQNYYVSVKNFSSFLNFFKLKAKLDQIPETEHAIVDFSLCDFVDHTVMEGLNDYRRSFARKGGELEIIGLDIHSSTTQHPFALRKIEPTKGFAALNFTKRQSSIQKLAADLDWEYHPEPYDLMGPDPENFLFFQTKQLNYRSNLLLSQSDEIWFYDLSFSEGLFITKEDLTASFFFFKTEKPVPVFVLDRENFVTSIYHLAGLHDINFEQFPDFSKRFYLNGTDEKAIREFFSPELVFFFESHPFYHIESNGTHLMIKGKDRTASIQEIKRMLAFTQELRSLLLKTAKR
ncbi:MAG: SulP family inorganic anion transporter [Bacteroidetes bacterium]|nr:SulP family inorganic anion transporter [Bacteroidota bacterium]MDA0938115.1 SulP family inorganic anion transporter [Bacteroidota bacterium]MDA1344545.1 SulP family inorganic anion transporter [Bacteroidota bacterium]